jgi:magnesium transporter
MAASSTPPPRSVRVVLAATALLSFRSVWKAAALALAELGVAAFFVIGIERSAVGDIAPWLVLAACAIGAYVRSIDVESWGYLIPGGSVGRAEHAFGPRSVSFAAAAVLTERLLLSALACVIIGRYAASPLVGLIGGWRTMARLSVEELVWVVAIIIIGLLWLRARLGFDLAPKAIARSVWIGLGILLVITAVGVVSAIQNNPQGFLRIPSPPKGLPSWSFLAAIFPILMGLGRALPAVGGGDALSRAAHEFPPPRTQALRRTGSLVVLVSVLIIALPAFLFTQLVPAAEAERWASMALAGLVRHLTGPAWISDVLALAVIIAAVLILVPAAHSALEEAELMLRRLARERRLPSALVRPHPRFGTPTGTINATAAAAVGITLASSGQVAWLARAYAIAVAITLVLKIATVLRLRAARVTPPPFRAPFNLRVRGRDIPAGLLIVGLLAIVSGGALIAGLDVPAMATAGLFVGFVLLFSGPWQGAAETRLDADRPETFELLPSADLALGQINVRHGCVLVTVRNPHALSHVTAALDASRDRDVVVMTVRLVGIDVEEDASESTESTSVERVLFSQVLALAERRGRPVRLLVVPAHDVFDAVVATAIRLGASDVYVGESTSLSADEQARLLGEAWERAEKTEDLKVRLVIHHHSGRADAYHLGAHPPALSPGDLDLIHRLWLDATKAIGPHVHHHDVVRAALTQMEQQLSGPQRDEALGVIREVTRPADELASAVQARDFTRLRDMTRNRHASDLATLLTELSVEDQVIVFRVLPRKDAAAVFEYLSHEAQETLLKAMAHEDIAALLNNMAPDDRTMFLEELPASVTRQLLALLTPAERSVAVTLLGYPENSVGRLMTPNYVRVQENWTIREVLDHIRTHGQDSETLNHVYVIDQQGQLVDDIRIRELLLTSPDHKVSDLMDRQFVALTATDDQQTAVAAFRKYDRTALPVTDTAGVLIGIVTIDDVLDVAEAAATKEIQRIGGSEALEEPYTQIAIGRMIQKRAGWLTALFLGEMLTATAMGFFEAEIAKAVVLVLFVPLIVSSGGNSGSQASTLVIRALALGEVTLSDWWRVMRREILVGLALGVILGSVGFLRITVWSAFGDPYGPHWLLIGLAVSFALIGVVLWGTLVGSMLPLILRRLGFDPATSSAPFVATLVDVTGLMIYFGVAIVLLRGTVLV